MYYVCNQSATILKWQDGFNLLFLKNFFLIHSSWLKSSTLKTEKDHPGTTIFVSI